ncbi:MAG TPA: hypothetical protein VGJ08_01750 [Rhizomicrobium sp.]|jgi:hypothetical protein
MARFVRGQSGNPAGRPKSAYLCERARATAKARPDSADFESKNTLALREGDATSRERQKADHALSGIVANANTARAFGQIPFGELDLTSAVDVLKEKASAVVSGNLSGIETSLLAQAAALDSIFNALALRSVAIIDRQLHNGETYLRLALRAQSQCRATLQTLAEIKNPPTVFARQANIANGPQQVNNEMAQTPSRARENENGQNKLLGNDHGERLDARAACATSGTDSPVGTLAEINGAKV